MAPRRQAFFFLVVSIIAALGGAAKPYGTPAPATHFEDVFGSDAVQCSGAQMVATENSLLVWGICAPNSEYPTANLTISMRRSSDWGKSWEPAIQQPFPNPSLPTIVYDAGRKKLVSRGYCTPGPGSGATSGAGAGRGGVTSSRQAEGGCPALATCSWHSADQGRTWSGPTKAGAFGSGEGCGGMVLSSGTILMPAGLVNCSGHGPSFNVALISTDGGATWRAGGATPLLPTGQGWGEAMVAELSNGSVVLNSRLSWWLGRHHARIQTAFAISHDRAASWDRVWSFPGDQPFDVGFGPG